ncbi:putative acetyltransferase [Chryseobacterium sp. SORGH_AS909]|uniref:Acetyltransferase n=2 Tax=Chryseobacterium group TaxID=2782232 RepID=A0ABU0TDX9_9FLAO|nr:putative acetyltransferase [Chryseobacterium camelliae]MDQ1098980.1 putative acetyltransferase [Chryseobacterium sp. SORGH_AS_1048]MDR6086328.1 putative acetyltransferase [Chryseobacterium sp. SORGH_AS_0909]MDR6130700.1 putative acetyltransferase [Chryseobacterium sp. SORGH_AS_1175]MDT3407169.1 putative acetyltransferase [Pseudacidovorax intermedius]
MQTKFLSMKCKSILAVLFLSGATLGYAQRIDSEQVSFQLLKEPLNPVDSQSRNFSVVVNSPYNMTKEDVIKEAKEKFQKQVDNYDQSVQDAKLQHEERLKDYEAEVKKLTEKYKTESEQYNKMKAVEKIAMNAMPPVLRLPSRPQLNVPQKPVYRDPDLRSALIVDNKVLASQVNIDGFSRGGNAIDISINMERTNFQDNAGKSFASQPTKLVVKQNGAVKIDKILFSDFEEIASSPTNEINLSDHERMYLQKVMNKINEILADNFGYSKINSTVKLETVKNKGEYDDLEKASIYVTTNLKKLQARPDYTPNKAALENMDKGITLWKDALKKINYEDKKAAYNAKIAAYLYMNLIRLNLALGKKPEAEKYLNEMQEHLVDMKLSFDQNYELKGLEQKIYN